MYISMYILYCTAQVDLFMNRWGWKGLDFKEEFAVGKKKPLLACLCCAIYRCKKDGR